MFVGFSTQINVPLGPDTGMVEWGAALVRTIHSTPAHLTRVMPERMEHLSRTPGQIVNFVFLGTNYPTFVLFCHCRGRVRAHLLDYTQYPHYSHYRSYPRVPPERGMLIIAYQVK
jgi:hypothetical protein